MARADPMTQSRTSFGEPTQTSAFFLGGWVLAGFASVIVLMVLGYADGEVDQPIAVIGASLVAAWSVQLGAAFLASKRAGSGNPVHDLGLSWKSIDLIGVPIGIAAQLGLLQLVYWPLQSIWPDVFSQTKLEENARDLVDGVGGAEMGLLFVLVVIGAPIVEEIFYRGLLQRPWLQRFGRADRASTSAVVVVVVAAVFAAIHFRPIEFPGLFAFGLVVGAMAASTGRLGMAATTHIAFNATALLLVV